MGYLSKEVRVAGGTNPKIMLEPDSKVGDRIRVYIKNQVEYSCESCADTCTLS